MNIERRTMNNEHRTMNTEGGVVLLLTMVVLLILATLGYNLTVRVATQRHRDNYVIDYTAACYARDSAVKYTLSTLQDINNIVLISRPNEPDFSDLFAMSEKEYRQLLEQWAKELAKRQAESQDETEQAPGSETEEPNDANEESEDALADVNFSKSAWDMYFADINSGKPKDRNKNIKKLLDSNEVNEINEVNAAEPNAVEPNALEEVTIRGPYGPPWPYVTEPVELEIGPAKVKIEIEDENAKYPLGWAVLGDEKVKREAEASIDTFCEWMGLSSDETDVLKDQLEKVGSIKPFQVQFQQVTQRIAVKAPPPPASRRRGRRTARTAYRTRTVTPVEQLTKQARDFSRLFHSSLINTDVLARPTIESEDRKESALKYMSLWGTTQVNVNSATRQVLESAFVFGGSADQIASEIIKKRREKPFTNTDELKKELLGYATSIDKCSPYITTASNIFSIRVSAFCGAAKASAVIVVLREGGKIEQVAVING
jgi:hypothetical protein